MLLGPDEITATSCVDDDSAMGQQPLRQVAGERQCSGLRQSDVTPFAAPVLMRASGLIKPPSIAG